MKVNGSFILRSIAGDHVLVPVGDTAARFNGMVVLNGPGALIWQGICDGKTQQQILAQLLEEFAVEPQQAEADYREFVEDMLQAQLLTE